MQDIVEQITALEWELFQEVHNQGGRAACQDNHQAFAVNRKSQFLAWSREAAASYLEDCRAAKESGRNLLTEKYARMMAWTAPKEYAEIAPLLPPVSEEAAALADLAAAAQIPWQEEFAMRCPRLASRGRPIRMSEEKDAGVASFETYLRGELLTYSLETLRLYVAHLAALKEEGKNISLVSMEHMVRLSGIESLEEAEARAAGGA